MPIKHTRKICMSVDIPKGITNYFNTSVLTKVNRYLSLGFKVPQIRVYYKSNFKHYDNITTYDSIEGPTIDMENCIVFKLENRNKQSTF